MRPFTIVSWGQVWFWFSYFFKCSFCILPFVVYILLCMLLCSLLILLFLLFLLILKKIWLLAQNLVLFPSYFSMLSYVLEFLIRYFNYFYIIWFLFLCSIHCIIFFTLFLPFKESIHILLPHLFTQNQVILYLLKHWSISGRTTIKFISHF